MDLDTLKRTIQKFFQEDTVTIVGSGLSVAEDIPGMKELASELQDKIPLILSNSTDMTLWERISNELKSGVGLEQTLQNHKPSQFIEENIRKLAAHFIGASEAKVFSEIIEGTRILRFSDYLHRFNIRNNGLIVITTNYDRLIEYSCEFNHVCVDTLCIGKYLANFSPNESKYQYCNGAIKVSGKQKLTFSPKVTVLKPHGCLSWHQMLGMPYSMSNYSLDDCLIITPGLDKYKRGYSEPFDKHRNRANVAIDQAQSFIIIGYGFGDDHLETHLVRQLKNNKSALILTQALTHKAIKLIKDCKNIIAICSENTNDSKVVTSKEEIVFTGVNLWDLREMIKEVF